MAGWIVLFILIAAAFAVLQALVLPTLFLSDGYYNLPEDYSDDGLKKYIKKYSITEDSGKKYLYCKFADGAKDFGYDIIVYDRTGCVCKVIGAAGDTAEKPQLPSDASAVRLALTSENGIRIKNERANRYGSAALSAYFISSALLAFLFALGALQCFAHIYGNYFENSFLSGCLFILVILTAIIAIFEIIAVLVYIKRGGFFKKFKASVPVWLFTAIVMVFASVCTGVFVQVFKKTSNYFEADGVVYALESTNNRDDCNVYVTGITANKAVIPKYVGGHAVTHILVLDSAVRELTIEGDVTIISEAFSKCNRLTTVVMNSVTNVPSRAFCLCKSLETVEMKSVESIGFHAFYYCENLSLVTVNPQVSYGTSAFEGCQKLQIKS